MKIMNKREREKNKDGARQRVKGERDREEFKER
jgi:hypothetical protein